MGSYYDLLLMFSEIYFSKNENLILDKMRNILQTNKNLNLNTEFFCSKINLTYLVIHRQYYNILKLIINYDKTQITKEIVKKSFYTNHYLMNYTLINQYKKNLGNKEEYIKLLKILLKKSIKLNYHHNFKIICHEIYKIKKRKSPINKLLKKYKESNNVKYYNSRMKLLFEYPSLCLPFRKKYHYPTKLQENLNIIYILDLPEELINIICNYYICNYYINNYYITN